MICGFELGFFWKVVFELWVDCNVELDCLFVFFGLGFCDELLFLFCLISLKWFDYKW